MTLKTQLPEIPAALADVALIDARACATTGGMGISWWHAEVAAGRAPKPVIQQPRCTRWRLKDVREFWADRAEKADRAAADRLTAQATKASAAASAQRRRKAMATVEG